MRKSLVELHIGLFDDDMGTFLKGFADSGSCLDTIGPGFIGGCCQNTPYASVRVDKAVDVVLSAGGTVLKEAHDEGTVVGKTHRLPGVLL